MKYKKTKIEFLEGSVYYKPENICNTVQQGKTVYNFNFFEFVLSVQEESKVSTSGPSIDIT